MIYTGREERQIVHILRNQNIQQHTNKDSSKNGVVTDIVHNRLAEARSSRNHDDNEVTSLKILPKPSSPSSMEESPTTGGT